MTATPSAPAAPGSPASGSPAADLSATGAAAADLSATGAAAADLPESGSVAAGAVGPEDALAELVAGNRRFVAGTPLHGHDVAAAAAASGGQEPRAVVVGCIDSRVPLEAIFDQTFGSICVVRSGAHVVDRAVLGSVGFAVGALGVPLIMVLGHVRCGAVAATVDALRSGEHPPGDVGYLVDEIAPAVRAVGVDGPDTADAAMREHVRRTVGRMGEAPGVAEAVAAGRVSVAGAVYDLDTGLVELL